MILNEVCKYELLKKEEQEKQQEECKHIENNKKSMMIARIFLKPGMMKNYHQLLI